MEEKKTKTDVKSKPKDEKQKLFTLSSSPHLARPDNVRTIMKNVNMALLPAIVFGVYYFGFRSLLMILTAVISCVVTEIILNKLQNKKFQEGSAIVTGILLAMTLPPTLSLGFVVMGSVFAIAIGKQIFGGLGYNIFNPALLGRAFLQASFPVRMTTWENPKTFVDAKTMATPSGGFKFGDAVIKESEHYFDLLIGNTGGCIGETCALAIIAGGIFLLIKKYADWRIPVSYLGAVAVFGAIFWLINPEQYPDPIYHLLSGGLMLGAFFMATDMVTSPITPRGSWIFGIGAGFLLVIIRLFGGLPEGVMYSILLMNAFTPLINRYTRPKFFGEVKS